MSVQQSDAWGETVTTTQHRHILRWLRFSLRTLLLVVTIAAIFLSMRVNQAEKQRNAIVSVKQLGGWVHYGFEFRDGTFQAGSRSWVPRWILDRTGIDLFHNVVEVNMVYNNDGPTRLDNHTTSDQVSLHLTSFHRLKRLFLKDTQASDSLLRVVGRLKYLEEIHMWNAATVTDRGAAFLGNLPKLRSIHLSHSQITDESLRVFGQMPRLEKLSLQGNQFTDAGLSYLKNLAQLRSLWVDMGVTNITDEGVEFLFNLKALEELGIQQTYVTDEKVQQLKSELPNLKKVYHSCVPLDLRR
jgi:hypothetical protein